MKSMKVVNPMNNRYYVKRTRIHDRNNPDCYITLDVACHILNKQHQLLCECEKEFRRYDGRRLFDTTYVVYSNILSKLFKYLKRNEED